MLAIVCNYHARAVQPFSRSAVQPFSRSAVQAPLFGESDEDKKARERKEEQERLERELEVLKKQMTDKEITGGLILAGLMSDVYSPTRQN